MKNRKIFYGILIAVGLALIGIGFLAYKNILTTPKDIGSFEDCVKAGYPVSESYPRQCESPDGRIFTEQTTLPAKPLEGICENLCGDGICQEVVCMEIGCPCPETLETCPEDCK